VVRPFDTVARLGGDEFAVLIEDLAGPEEAVLVADRFLEELAVSFDLEGPAVGIGASVGIAVAGAGATTCDDLLREADVAMYRAKQRGKATVETFDASMQRSLERGLQLRSDFEKAVAAGELHIEYQPVVAVDTGRVVGVEALARWESAGRGRVGPREFIPVAEASGLIHEVGQWVLRTACAQAVAWMAGLPERDLIVGVNVSPRELLHPGFAHEVAAILRETGLTPALLTLEITESLLTEGTAVVLERLRALKGLGVTLAIDDFGTGRSSLGDLRSLPVDALKIPKAFVDNIATDARERAFLAGIIGLGRTLDLRLVAVGVEREEQLHELREMRCDLVQGFHLAAPLDAAGVGEMLAREAGAGPLDLSRRVWKAAQGRAPQGDPARLPRSA
jgi:predicted signal transduction protein with EAL and GGDEF domain